MYSEGIFALTGISTLKAAQSLSAGHLLPHNDGNFKPSLDYQIRLDQQPVYFWYATVIIDELYKLDSRSAQQIINRFSNRNKAFKNMTYDRAHSTAKHYAVDTSVSHDFYHNTGLWINSSVILAAANLLEENQKASDTFLGHCSDMGIDTLWYTPDDHMEDGELLLRTRKNISEFIFRAIDKPKGFIVGWRQDALQHDLKIIPSPESEDEILIVNPTLMPLNSVIFEEI